MQSPAERPAEQNRRRTDQPLDRPEVSVVVPVYNESPNIPALHERLIAALDALGRPFELVFVDDGSRDRTWELIDALCDENERFEGL